MSRFCKACNYRYSIKNIDNKIFSECFGEGTVEKPYYAYDKKHSIIAHFKKDSIVNYTFDNVRIYIIRLVVMYDFNFNLSNIEFIHENEDEFIVKIKLFGNKSCYSVMSSLKTDNECTDFKYDTYYNDNEYIEKIKKYENRNTYTDSDEIEDSDDDKIDYPYYIIVKFNRSYTTKRANKYLFDIIKEYDNNFNYEKIYLTKENKYKMIFKIDRINGVTLFNKIVTRLEQDGICTELITSDLYKH